MFYSIKTGVLKVNPFLLPEDVITLQCFLKLKAKQSNDKK